MLSYDVAEVRFAGDEAPYPTLPRDGEGFEGGGGVILGIGA